MKTQQNTHNVKVDLSLAGFGGALLATSTQLIEDTRNDKCAPTKIENN